MHPSQTFAILLIMSHEINRHINSFIQWYDVDTVITSVNWYTGNGSGEGKKQPMARQDNKPVFFENKESILSMSSRHTVFH
jgi:hypothetical protein